MHYESCDDVPTRVCDENVKVAQCDLNRDLFLCIHNTL